MDGPDRIGKEEMKEFVESYRDELIELVCVNYMMNKFYITSYNRMKTDYFILRQWMTDIKTMMILLFLFSQDLRIYQSHASLQICLEYTKPFYQIYLILHPIVFIPVKSYTPFVSKLNYNSKQLLTYVIIIQILFGFYMFNILILYIQSLRKFGIIC